MGVVGCGGVVKGSYVFISIYTIIRTCDYHYSYM